MKRKFFTLLAGVALFSMANAADPKLVIPYAGTAPKIDGNIDESDPWGTSWIDLSVERTTATTHDMTAKFQLMSDSKAVYLAVQVMDATPNNDTTIKDSYQRDNVEIFFSMETDTLPGGKYKEGTWQIRVQRDAVSKAAFIDGNHGKPGGGDYWNVDELEANADFAFGVVNDADKWTAEVKFPYSALATATDTVQFDGQNFLFDLAAADNSNGKADGRTQQRYWNNNSDDQWKNASLFNLVQTQFKVGVKQASVSTKASAYVSANNLVVANIAGTVNVYDVTGKLVLKSSIKNGNISLAALKSGMYIVKADNLSKKIIK
jgi:hypothetical protein